MSTPGLLSSCAMVWVGPPLSASGSIASDPTADAGERLGAWVAALVVADVVDADQIRCPRAVGSIRARLLGLGEDRAGDRQVAAVAVDAAALGVVRRVVDERRVRDRRRSGNGDRTAALGGVVGERAVDDVDGAVDAQPAALVRCSVSDERRPLDQTRCVPVDRHAGALVTAVVDDRAVAEDEPVHVAANDDAAAALACSGGARDRDTRDADVRGIDHDALAGAVRIDQGGVTGDHQTARERHRLAGADQPRVRSGDDQGTLGEFVRARPDLDGRGFGRRVGDTDRRTQRGAAGNTVRKRTADTTTVVCISGDSDDRRRGLLSVRGR